MKPKNHQSEIDTLCQGLIFFNSIIVYNRSIYQIIILNKETFFHLHVAVSVGLRYYTASDKAAANKGATIEHLSGFARIYCTLCAEGVCQILIFFTRGIRRAPYHEMNSIFPAIYKYIPRLHKSTKKNLWVREHGSVMHIMLAESSSLTADSFQ